MKITLWMLFVQAALVMAMKDDIASSNNLTSLQKDQSNHEKIQTLFPQRGLMEHQRLQSVKPRVNPALVTPRCSRVKESCGPHSRSHCCDPCASCRCRFFNTICYCLKLDYLCQKRT